MNINEKVIRARLNNKSISDLKSILDICKENAKTSVIWGKRAEIVEEILVSNVKYIFD